MTEKGGNSLAKKMVQVMSEVTYIEKTGKNTQQGYKYASDEEILKRVQTAMVNAGIAFFTSTYETDMQEIGKTRAGNSMFLVTVKTDHIFMDTDTDQFFSVKGIGQGTDTGDKGVYKAITGATKYALMKSLLLPTGDDPERDQKEEIAPVKAPKKQATSSAKKAPAKTPPADPADKASKVEIWKGYQGAMGSDEEAKAAIIRVIGNKPKEEWTQRDIGRLQGDLKTKLAVKETKQGKLIENQDPPEGFFEEKEASEEMSSLKQQQYIHTLATQAGKSDDVLYEEIYWITGRPITSTKELTKQEAMNVITKMSEES